MIFVESNFYKIICCFIKIHQNRIVSVLSLKCFFAYTIKNKSD